jgi:hypothetical protein
MTTTSCSNSAGALTNEGFFDTSVKTRRDGIEANSVRRGRRSASPGRSPTPTSPATFRESFTVMSPNHPEAVRRRDRSRERRPVAVDPQHC